MLKKILYSIMLFMPLSLMFCVSNFADSCTLKDGRVINGDFQEESADYVIFYEPDTKWRVGLWKNMISSIQIKGVTYSPVIPGEMIRPAAKATQAVEVPIESTAPKKGIIVIKEETPKSGGPVDKTSDKNIEQPEEAPKELKE